MTQRVLVDANVLASRILTDWLFHLRKCNRDMFSILWNRDIQAEAIRAMRKKHPGWSGSAIERHFEIMEGLIDDSVVAPDDDHGFSGADPEDFHVHAAAVGGNVHYILTDNRPEDFTSHPGEESYEIINSDDFFNLVADSNQPRFVATVAGQFAGCPILCVRGFGLQVIRGSVGVDHGSLEEGLFPPLRYTLCGVMR